MKRCGDAVPTNNATITQRRMTMSDTENTVTETTTQDAVDQTVTAVDADTAVVPK